MRIQQICIRSGQLAALVQWYRTGQKELSDDTAFWAWVLQWQGWEVEFICLALSASQTLTSLWRNGLEPMEILERINELSISQGILTIEEMNDGFVRYLWGFPRSEDSSIEDELISIRNQLSDRYFPRNFTKP